MHKKVAIDNVEIIPRNAGHVIGSYEFEVNTPEGNILFTGDINTEYTKTMEPAETLECDILVLEATFGSPNFIFPSEEVVAEDMVNWARRAIKMGKFPAFQTDPLGNAQEVIRIFNESNIPVITHWKVTRISDIYKSHGYNLEYLDAKSEDAEEVIRSGNFVLVTPKNFDLRNRPEYVPALVSGWALSARRKAFPLSDHADFPRLVKFVEECRPKIALTCHGERFDEIFARYIEKKLKIRAYPIHLIPTSLKSKH
jgi:Cft2 family RNA processing exonuclease